VSPPLEIFVNLFASPFEWMHGLKIAPESDNCFTSSLHMPPDTGYQNSILMVIHRSYLFNYAICYLVLVEYLLVRRILTINIFPLQLVSLELRTQFIENSRKLFYTTDLIYIYKSYNRRNAALNLSRMLYRFVTKMQQQL